MFPALNIVGVARVELASRTLDNIENEAKAIFTAIALAREKAGRVPPSEGTVADAHRVLFRLVRHNGETGAYGYTHHAKKMLGRKESE